MFGRNKIVFVLLCSLSLFAFTSCSEDKKGISIKNSEAFTENDFFHNSELRADLRSGVIAMFLEHPNSSVKDNDTGVLGRDIIPITYSMTTSHTFCWEDEDQEAKHLMTMNDINGIEIIRLVSNGECVTEIIEPGDYDIILHHDGRKDRTYKIFLERQEDGLSRVENSGTGKIKTSIKM